MKRKKRTQTTTTEESSGWVKTHLPCPVCPSSDAYAINDKGFGYCFSCKATVPPQSDREGAMDAEVPEARRKKRAGLLTEITYKDIPNRGLTEESCRKWSYGYSTYSGKRCHVASYWRDGSVCAQKVRLSGKRFAILGQGGNDMPLYGMWLWGEGGKMVVITEGEIDAISVSQVQDHKWPVVSVPNGAQSAVKSIAKHLGWLNTFERIVLFFDNDEAGQKAVRDVARALPPGRVWVATFPTKYKDANEALLAGDAQAIREAIWRAKQYRPDGVVSIKDVREQALVLPKVVNPWPWEGLTKLTYGRRPGELIGIGAGTGVGKTDFFTECVAHDLQVLSKRVGMVYLEQAAPDTVKRVAGKLAKRRLHIPDAGWTEEELRAALESIPDDQLHLYNHFGAKDWPAVREAIQFMVSGLGCEHIYLDHLTALVAQEEDENAALKAIMEELASDAERLKVVIHFISHLATPEGKPHEEGGRVMIRHFRGSRTIGFWSHMLFGLERNQQAEDEAERNRMYVRGLKDRFTGNAVGKGIYLSYDTETGMLIETNPPSSTSSNRSFTDADMEDEL